MEAIARFNPDLAEKLQTQQRSEKKVEARVLLANKKYDYSTSFTDLLGSLLDRDESPGDSDYESGDKVKMVV